MDTLRIEQLEQKIHELEIIIDKALIREEYFSEIISSQQSYLTTQTAIFSVIVALFIGAIGLISWRVFHKRVESIETFLSRVNNELRDIEKTLQIHDQLYEIQKDKLDKIQDIAVNADVNASRALFDTRYFDADMQLSPWTIIANIRYCHSLVTNKKEETIEEQAIILNDLINKYSYNIDRSLRSFIEKSFYNEAIQKLEALLSCQNKKASSLFNKVYTLLKEKEAIMDLDAGPDTK